VSELDPQIVAYLEALRAAGAPAVGTIPAAELRANFEIAAPAQFGPVAPMASVEDRQTDGGIRVRVYRPGAADGPQPGLVYLHGGGWVVGSLDTHDGIVRALAAGSGRTAVSVDYRLAPEHPFPAGLEDATAATAWVIANAAELGVDAARVAVGGDSSGGALAAVVARRLPVELQLLVCPVTDHRFDTDSYERYADGFGLTRDAMRWYWAQYLGGDDGASPDASPLRADLAGAPPAVIAVAACDPLRDDGLAYAERIHMAATDVTVLRYEGMIHNFIRLPASVDCAAEALGEIAALLF
jgi:acetyl esterase